MPVLYRYKTSVIADAAALGAAVDIGDSILVGVTLDAAWDSGDQLGFKVCSTEGGTFVPLYGSTAALVTLAVAASRAYALDPRIIGQWRYVKPWSQNGSGTDATQGGATTVTFCMK